MVCCCFGGEGGAGILSVVELSLLITGNPKAKLYKDINGEMKGDALCCYLKASPTGFKSPLFSEFHGCVCMYVCL